MKLIKEYFEQSSGRLKFRALTSEDIENWKVFFMNNDRLHFFGLQGDIDIEKEAEKWVNKQLNRYATQHLGLLAVIEKSKSELIGICGLIPREIDGVQELEVGYSFIPKYWGNGYATESAILMKEFAQKHKLAKRVISLIDTENYNSQAVAKRNGMTPAFETTFEGINVIVFATEDFESS